MKRHITLLGGIERPAVSYRTFKRSANNFRQFSSARKITVDIGLTYEEARRQCARFNENRDARQIRNGTMMEFTVED